MQLQPEVAISQQATLWQEAKPTEHVGGGHLLSLSSPIQQLVQQRLEDKTLVAVYEGDLQRQGMQRATATAHRGLDLKKLQAMQAAAKGKR